MSVASVLGFLFARLCQRRQMTDFFKRNFMLAKPRTQFRSKAVSRVALECQEGVYPVSRKLDLQTSVEKSFFQNRYFMILGTTALVLLLTSPAAAQNKFERFQTYLGTIDVVSEGKGLLRAGDGATGLAS